MRKLKRKKTAFEEAVEEPVKIKKRVVYKRKQCSFTTFHGVRCKKLAVGRGNVCSDHGGERVVPESQRTTTAMTVHVQRYDPITHPMEYIQLSRMGMSEVEIAAQFEVGVGTIKSWAEKYKEFSIAYEVGQAMHEAWWLREGKSHLDDRFYQTPLYKFLTGNKLGYSDKIETKNLNQNAYGVLVVPGEMSMDEWEEANKKEDEGVIDV